MDDIPKSSKESSRKEVLKRSSSYTREKNISKQQKRQDNHFQMHPGASGVDADKDIGSCNDPSLETLSKQKSIKTTHSFDLNFILPDLNETIPPEPMSTDHVDKGSNFQIGSLCATDDLEDVVKVLRRLEMEGHISRDFRMKFLTWYSLKSTKKESDVVCIFIRNMNDDLSCLAAQLIDSFSDIIK